MTRAERLLDAIAERYVGGYDLKGLVSPGMASMAEVLENLNVEPEDS